MSTDWIKMRVDLRTHPKVVRMASALKADKLRVIGGLFAVWGIFDAHSADGLLAGYTLGAIDDDLGWRGFARAMAAVEWLVEFPGELAAPRFEEHNGQSAKRRAMETERKRLERGADKEKTKAGQLSALDADKKRSREEKRREDSEPIGSSLGSPKARAARKCPATFEPESPQAWISEHCPGLDWQRETEKFRDCTFKTARTDWAGTWRNWMRKAHEDTSSQRPAMSFRERDEANAIARVHEITGGLVSAKPKTRLNDALQEVFDAPRRLG